MVTALMARLLQRKLSLQVARLRFYTQVRQLKVMTRLLLLLF